MNLSTTSSAIKIALFAAMGIPSPRLLSQAGRRRKNTGRLSACPPNNPQKSSIFLCCGGRG